MAAYPVGGWDNGSDVQVSASSPVLGEGAQIKQGPLLSPSDSGWHVDAGRVLALTNGCVSTIGSENVLTKIWSKL